MLLNMADTTVDSENVPPLPVAFSSINDVRFQKDVSEESSLHSPTSSTTLIEKYELARCLQWITNNGFQRVSLQFPDECLVDSAAITAWLDGNVSGKVFVLGDTSYGSCCVDEVSAQHYTADSIIHFGYTCLSPTKRLPVLYIFGRYSIDVEDCCAKFQEIIPDPMSKVIIYYDVRYTHAIDDFKASITVYENVLITKLNVPTDELAEENDQGNQEEFSNHSICGRTFTVPDNATICDYSVFFIGEEGLLLTNLMFSFPKCPLFFYNTVSKEICQETLINKKLMRRYYMIERIKDANIIGIVVGTLGVSDYLQCVHRMESIIKKAEKKSYTFVVGKLNVAKLSNFLEIDIFVLVACAENSLIDSKEFFKPIVTPFEVEIALNSSREWTGDYYTDFRQLLPGAVAHVPLSDGPFDNTDVSLITGKLRTLGQSDNQPEPSDTIIARPEALSVTTVKAKDAGEFLAQRSWQGLQPQLGETPVTKAVEGSSGIAWKYSHECS
ncbi:2-3-amino-3-carboxypropylhistidine synthase subunit 2-like [Octopus vulgaris]|uniref:2-(3-amino-3-carboxypropyl)histidine synthase subunit 2 n=1 Tax=Octopus vulgaris TaxID=6645 RepID=A0AA36F8Y2_OCTVU|nr:2-3-amino-3-carboxypropylhistidine synthase subunit 2-like [Octopus vulgaris]